MVQVAQKRLNSLFISQKSKLPNENEKKHNLIYEVPCLHCPKKDTDMRTQYLNNSLNGHKYSKNVLSFT